VALLGRTYHEPVPLDLDAVVVNDGPATHVGVSYWRVSAT
jgi:hypothetical protein